jgi:heptosyltransferase III
LRYIVIRGGALGDLLLTLPVLQAVRRVAGPSAGCEVAAASSCGTGRPSPKPFGRSLGADISVELIAPFPAASLGLIGGADKVSDLNSAAFLSLFADESSLSEELRLKFRGTDCVLSYLSDRRGTVRAKIERCGCRFIPGPFKLDDRRIPATIQLAEPLCTLGIADIDPVPRLALVRENRSNRLAFHVGSGSPTKNWPTGRWKQLVASLESRFSELLLLSGEADEAATAEFLAQYGSPKLRLGSRLPLLDLAHELAATQLFIGHDTGPTHLAAALGVPTVALFGPTDPMIWRPTGKHVQVVASEIGRMDGLRFDEVQSAVEGILQKRELA